MRPVADLRCCASVLRFVLTDVFAKKTVVFVCDYFVAFAADSFEAFSIEDDDRTA